VLGNGPASFKSEFDWRTGDPEGLLLLDGVVWVPAQRKWSESCRKCVNSRNLSSGMIYSFHISKQECRYNIMWIKLSVTSLKDVFLTERRSPSLSGRRVQGFIITLRLKAVTKGEAVPYLRRHVFIWRPKTQGKSLTFRGLRSGCLR
jgi:hypothetical protein